MCIRLMLMIVIQWLVRLVIAVAAACVVDAVCVVIAGGESDLVRVWYMISEFVLN